MRQMGLKGIVRGKTVKTMISEADAACPVDCVNRQFSAERTNALWVADFTYAKTWQGFIYVAFVIDVFFSLYRRLEGLRFRAYGFCIGRAGAGFI